MDPSESQSAWKKLGKQRWLSVQMQRSEDGGRVYVVIDGVSPDPYPKAHTRRASIWDVSALEGKACLPSTCGSVWVFNGLEDTYHTVGVSTNPTHVAVTQAEIPDRLSGQFLVLLG